MNSFRNIPGATAIESWPGPFRGLLGCAAAALTTALTYWIVPLRAFPVQLAFPTVILCAWFLGMWGGVCCALTEAILVNLFLTKTQLRFSLANAPQFERLALFFLLSILVAAIVRSSAQRRAALYIREWQERVTLANAERHAAEERARVSETLRDRDDMLQIAVRANNMGLWAWDLRHGTVSWSDEVYRILGHEPGSIQPSFETALKFIHPDDVDGVAQSAALTEAGGSEFNSQYRIVWPDGSVHWLESQGKYQRDGKGEPVRVVGVISDVTRRKQSEEAMLRAEKLAVAGRLAASVAHEINNPLEAVTNLLYLIATAESVAAAQAQAQQALDQLMRVSVITQQTLKFHRQYGKPTCIHLSEIVQTVLALFRARLEQAQIEVDIRTEGEFAIECMSGEIQQVFLNLVSNAIDAMPFGGRLIVRLRPSYDWRHANGQGGRVAGMRATLHDSGVGMDPATMKRIFEPFFTTKVETGTGLGMWVVAQLVERHRGHIHARSTQRPGRTGTAFSIFLPRENPSIASLSGPPATDRSQPAQTAVAESPLQASS